MLRTTKTMDEMLIAGREKLAAAEREKKQREELSRRRTLDNWKALLAAVEEEIGEVVGSASQGPPDNFHGGTWEWSLEVRPFAAAPMVLSCVFCNDGGSWEVSRAVRVAKWFYPRHCDDASNGHWHSFPDCWEEVQGIEHALALCEKATEAYRECERKCRQLENKPKTPDKPALDLSEAEEAFIVALRALRKEEE